MTSVTPPSGGCPPGARGRRGTMRGFHQARHDVAGFQGSKEGERTMSAVVAQNRFAPPRADVEDQRRHRGPHGRCRTRGPLPRRADRRRAAEIAGILIARRRGDSRVRELQAGARARHRPAGAGQRPSPVDVWAFFGGIALAGYFIYSVVLVYLYGQTFGKRVMDIRVVRVDGTRVDASRASSSCAGCRWPSSAASRSSAASSR